ncbi:MAG: MarR family transcriptional regulator [Coriobacteriia bacterium]|nr:MarR family transcriptional regulator [Coriobacteriia bacterium]MBN2839859.1 MarR family transcriptional regulator [Coriobacteriia bacterium]
MHHHTHPPTDAFDSALEGVDPLSLDVFKAQKRSMVLSRHLMMSSLSSEESHPGQAACLLALSTSGGMSQSELADVLHVSKPTVTVMLQKLEAAGALERRTDEHDQRVTRLFLTQRGVELAERMRAVHAEIINTTIGRLSEADRRELLRLLTILNGHAAARLHGEDVAR